LCVTVELDLLCTQPERPEVGLSLLTVETVVKMGGVGGFWVCVTAELACTQTERYQRGVAPSLLTAVETEVNGDSKSKNERGPSLVGSLGSSYQYKGILSYLGCSMVSPEEIIFFLTLHYFNLCVTPSPSNLGRQS
jgi:hypothetical protein